MSNTLTKEEIKALTKKANDLAKKERVIDAMARKEIESLLSKCEDNEFALPVGTDDDLSVWDDDNREYRSINKVKLVPYQGDYGMSCHIILMSDNIWYFYSDTNETYAQILNRMVNELD